MRRSIESVRSRPGSAARTRSTFSTMRPRRSRITRFGAGRAAQPFVERELEAFLAAVVDVGEAEHVRDHLAVRVEAAELALRVHARHAEREDRAGPRPA